MLRDSTLSHPSYVALAVCCSMQFGVTNDNSCFSARGAKVARLPLSLTVPSHSIIQRRKLQSDNYVFGHFSRREQTKTSRWTNQKTALHTGRPTSRGNYIDGPLSTRESGQNSMWVRELNHPLFLHANVLSEMENLGM